MRALTLFTSMAVTLLLIDPAVQSGRLTMELVPWYGSRK